MNQFLRSLYIAIIALATGYFAGHSSSEQSRLTSTPFPLPISEVIIERGPYTLAYDGRHKQARWVYENLTADRLKGVAERKSFSFLEDPLVPVLMRATTQDYAGSGFDRGHLCPAADAKHSEAFMKETFYLSNVSPQCPEFNRGFWAKLEKRVRNLSLQYGNVHVFTGGLYLPQEEGKNVKFVKYSVIGENGVAVPTHFFKVIFDANRSLIEAYILPNAPISAATSLEQFYTPLFEIERAAGIEFSKKPL